MASYREGWVPVLLSYHHLIHPPSPSQPRVFHTLHPLRLSSTDRVTLWVALRPRTGNKEKLALRLSESTSVSVI